MTLYNDNNIDKLILRVLLNEASEMEILDFHHWMQTPENEQYFEQVKLLWVASAQKAAKDLPCNAISKKQYLTFIVNEKRRHKRTLSAVFGIAAALIAVSFLVWQINVTSSTKETIAILTEASNSSSVHKFIRKIKHESIVLVTSDGVEHVIDPTLDIDARKEIDMVGNQLIRHTVPAGHIEELADIQYNTLYVPRGKRFCIELSDSTIMWVNSDTKVKYPVVFPKDKREVWVEGNAYFDVAKDASRPFEVKTGVITTVALGTIFEVENYDSFKCKITLLEGAVKINNNQREVVLAPNQQATMEAGKEEIICSAVDSYKYGRWKDSLIVFDNEPLNSLLAKLSRWHNVDIINNAQELNVLHFSGSLSNATLNEHLKIIANNIKIKYIIKEGNVYIGL